MGRVSEADDDPSPQRSRVQLAWRATAGAVLLGAAGVGFGVLTLRLQEHFRADQARGESLNPFTGLLADGSGPRTAWIGYAAAILFISAVLRLGLGPVEPPVGGLRRSAAEMRAAFRAEHRLVRAALAAVIVVTALDTGRAIVYTGAAVAGRAAARDNAAWVIAEAAGMLIAAGALLLWTRLFRRQLERVGAM